MNNLVKGWTDVSVFQHLGQRQVKPSPLIYVLILHLHDAVLISHVSCAQALFDFIFENALIIYNATRNAYSSLIHFP